MADALDLLEYLIFFEGELGVSAFSKSESRCLPCSSCSIGWRNLKLRSGVGFEPGLLVAFDRFRRIIDVFLGASCRSSDVSMAVASFSKRLIGDSLFCRQLLDWNNSSMAVDEVDATFAFFSKEPPDALEASDTFPFWALWLLLEHCGHLA